MVHFYSLAMMLIRKSSRAFVKSVSLINLGISYFVCAVFSFSSLLYNVLRFGLLGTGFSDAMLDERSSSLRSQVIATPKVGYFAFLSGLLLLQYHIRLLPEFLLIVLIQIPSNTTELETASIQMFGLSPLR